MIAFSHTLEKTYWMDDPNRQQLREYDWHWLLSNNSTPPAFQIVNVQPQLPSTPTPMKGQGLIPNSRLGLHDHVQHAFWPSVGHVT